MKTKFKSADSLLTIYKEMSILSNIRRYWLASRSWLSALFGQSLADCQPGQSLNFILQLDSVQSCTD